MKAVIAIDSFKGSLTSEESGRAVREALLSVYPDSVGIICPLADGGEGTVSAVCSSGRGKKYEARVTGPLGEPVTAEYCVMDDGTAVIEIAEAAGLTLVPEHLRDPLNTTTYGVGELICHAVKQGCRRFIVGLGGSATNDGGAGMLSALGFGLLDREDKPVSSGARGLSQLSHITLEGALPELSECSFRVASDVRNPLCGPLGSSRVFGPQKGGTAELTEKMDSWLSAFASLTAEALGADFSTAAGAGAAGGLGFAFLAYLGAELESGIEVITELVGLPEHIRDADLVVTGEGRLDGQSCMGKAPVGVAALAKKYGKPTVAFAGAVTADAPMCNSFGIDAYFPIVSSPITLAEAMDSTVAYGNLKNMAEQVFRLMRASGFLVK